MEKLPSTLEIVPMFLLGTPMFAYGIGLCDDLFRIVPVIVVCPLNIDPELRSRNRSKIFSMFIALMREGAMIIRTRNFV
jgi:hypothetical protein